MKKREFVSLVITIVAAIVPYTAAPVGATPLGGLHYLVGPWKCTYRSGAMRLPYDATYVYDRDGHALRQVATWAGGGDEELLGYDAQHRSWTAIVLDDQGNATVMHATSSDPYHFAYHSIYPDPSIAETFDRVSAMEYTLHATVRSAGKTTTSVDICLRAGR